MLRAVSIAALLWTARFSAFELKIDVDNRTLTMPFFEDDDLIMAAVTLKDFTGLELVGAGCKPSKYSDCLLRRLVGAMIDILVEADSLDVEKHREALDFAQSTRYMLPEHAEVLLREYVREDATLSRFTKPRYDASVILLAGVAADTDKVTHHGYERGYWRFLPPASAADVSILEIGLARGASLKLWRSLYPTARVVGLDVGASEDNAPDPLTTILRGNQAHAEALNRCARAAPDSGCDTSSLLLDDGRS